jgi:hypothetical protein
VLRDDVRVGEIIATAFADVAMDERWSYPSFVARFDETIAPRLGFKERPSRAARIAQIRAHHPWAVIDNPHELDRSRFRIWRDRMAQTLRRVLRPNG